MMRVSLLRSAFIICMTLVMGTMALPVAGQDPKAILLIHTYGYDSPGRVSFDTGFARTLREASGGRVDLYVETIDPNHFSGEALARNTRTFLREKYAGKNIAVAAAVYDEALAFLLDERDPLFPSVPVAAVLAKLPESRPERVAVLHVGNMIGATVALALKLNPRARQVAVIDGAPPGSSGREAWNDEVVNQVKAMGLSVPVVSLHNLPLDELLPRVQALPPDGIILLVRQYIGPRGAPIANIDAAKALARVAPAPIYVNSDLSLGFGTLGGVFVPLESMGTETAKLALKISEKGSLPLPLAEARMVPMFDWRELRRWGIKESLLPLGSDVRYRELSLWDQYRWYVVAAVSVTLVQSALLAGLVIQQRRRRRVELALRESEQHFRVMADTAPVLIWRSGTDKACDFFNKPWLDFRGRTLEQEQGSGWTEGVHPDDRAACIHRYVEAFESGEPFRMEYRLRRADGEYRWVLHLGVPRYDDTGQFAGYIGSAIDITERKHIEQQNQDLAGRLINAQEEERARIARNMHDDLGQQLATIAIMLGELKRDIGEPGSEPDIDGTVTTLEGHASALGRAIRNISHELHPSVLEHVGLAAALRRHCAEVEEHHDLKVIFSAGDQLDSLSPEIALCLFRVAQEALSNVVRHARARTIRVQLRATNEHIELRVDDDGIGFVVSERIGGGLGLRSIDERVRLNRGHVSVESRPGQGTNLLVRIPRPAAQVELGRVS